jgi:methylated-DNA-[protein]-cysteine S-methyltransferase
LYQKKVWKELQRIPYGQSVYYSSIAERIRSSPRAVGNACGANKCLLIIPCHRVISKNIKGSNISSFGGLVHKNNILLLEKL